MTMEALLGAHLDHLTSRGREATTLRDYRAIAADPLGARSLRRVGVKDLDDFYARLGQSGRSAATVQRYHALLGAALQQATVWGWIPRNVARLASPPSVPNLPREVPPPAVVAALLRQARESRNPENYGPLRLLATTGMRRGEACGLRLRSVVLERSRLHISEAVAVIDGGELVVKDPKTPSDGRGHR